MLAPNLYISMDIAFRANMIYKYKVVGGETVRLFKFRLGISVVEGARLFHFTALSLQRLFPHPAASRWESDDINSALHPYLSSSLERAALRKLTLNHHSLLEKYFFLLLLNFFTCESNIYIPLKFILLEKFYCFFMIFSTNLYLIYSRYLHRVFNIFLITF